MKYSHLILLAGVAGLLSSQPSIPERVGPQPDGSFLLPTGWRIKPAGKQIPVDTFPMSSALSLDGKYLLVLNGGFKPPSISVISVASGQEIGRTPIADGWLGIAFAPNGKTVYAGGGSQAKVYEFAFSDSGKLDAKRAFETVPDAERKPDDFIGDVAVSPDGRLIYAADLFHDRIVVINPQSGRVIERYKTGRRPYRILMHPDGKSYFVSSWADGTVYQHQTNNGEQLNLIRLGQHPTDMLWREKKSGEGQSGEPSDFAARLFVTGGNTNSVFVVGISESKDMQLSETINVALSPRHPLGMTPSGLAMSTDQSQIFVVCSDANAVAVVDVTDKRSRLQGFIPTGWYPTAAKWLPNQTLAILNGRGLKSYPNPRGQIAGQNQTGTVSLVPKPTEDQLDAFTKTVLANSPYNDRMLMEAAIPAGNPIPSKPGDPSPIEHVIYVIKGSRSYDQVMGDMGRGNSDESLVLYGEKITPNQHKLAREFVLFDNFYVNANVSADGQSWATAGIAPDYVQRLSPNSEARRRQYYDYEGGEPANLPPAGYLWTSAAAAKISMRNYGYWVLNRKVAGDDGAQVESVKDSTLSTMTNPQYRGFDMEYSDADRVKVFLRDLAEFENTGNMPKLLIMRLGNDHTYGTAPGKKSPVTLIADNDYALGLLAEGVSKSKFWLKTAIFVIESDTQSGADHVDSHRSPAFVISPYTHRGTVDSSMYNQTSVLRTIELILGLHPMTHYDAGARPMFAAFQNTADARPYQAESPNAGR